MASLINPVETTRIAAIAVLDVVNSTGHHARLGEREWLHKLNSLFSTASALAAGNGGVSVIKTGDGFLAAFDEPEKAFQFAVETQRHLHFKKWDKDPVQVRIGVHFGRVTQTERYGGLDYVGDAVIGAARLSFLANPGEIVLSKDAAAGLSRQVRVSMHPEVVSLKGSPEPVEVMRAQL